MGYTLDAEEVGDFSELVGKDMLSYMQYDFGQGSRRLLVWPRFVLEGGGRCRRIAAAALPDVGGLPTVVSAHGWDRYRIESVYGRMCVAVLNTPDVNANTNYGLSEPHRYNAAVNPNMRSSVLELKRFETTPFSVQMAQVINVAGGLIDFSKPIEDLVHPYPWQAQPQCRHVLISQTGVDGRRLLWGPFEVGDAVEGACSVQASRSYDLLVRGIDASRFSDRVELLDDEGIPFAEFVSVSELDGLLAEAEAEYDWMGDDELVSSLAHLAKTADKPATRREMQNLRAALSAASEVEAAALVGGRRERMVGLLDAAESWAAMADEAKREAVEAMPAEQVAAFVLEDESFAGFMRRALEDGRVKERYDEQRAGLAAEAERERGRLEALKGELASAEEDLARVVSERGEVMEQVRAEHAAEIAEAEQRLAGLEAAARAAEGRVEELRQAEFAAKQAVANVMDGFRNEFKVGEKVLESVMVREIVAALGGPQPSAPGPVPAVAEPPAAMPAPAMLAGSAEMSPADVLDRICGLVREVGGRDLSRNEIANLAICLVQGYVTVLAGMPGAGKTSLAGILAGALGLRQPGAARYCEVPVERGWASYKDFIGYHNPLTQRVEAASSAAFAAFEEMTREVASGPADPAMRLVLLDEANLSSMEHYFSPFMMACDRFADGPFSIELGGRRELHRARISSLRRHRQLRPHHRGALSALPRPRLDDHARGAGRVRGGLRRRVGRRLGGRRGLARPRPLRRVRASRRRGPGRHGGQAGRGAARLRAAKAAGQPPVDDDDARLPFRGRRRHGHRERRGSSRGRRLRRVPEGPSVHRRTGRAGRGPARGPDADRGASARQGARPGHAREGRR